MGGISRASVFRYFRRLIRFIRSQSDSKPYSFGLGKRSDDDYAEYTDFKPKLTYDQIKMILPFITGRQTIDDGQYRRRTNEPGLKMRKISNRT